MVAALTELIALNRQGASAAAQSSGAVYSHALRGTVLAMALAAIATAILATLLTRSIVRPLAEAVQVADSVASGNLTLSFDTRGNDEPARLLLALKSMQGNLRGTIEQIADASDQLTSAAEQLSAVTENTALNLHQQSQEIDQAATAVTEMSTAVDEVARNAASALAAWAAGSFDFCSTAASTFVPPSRARKIASTFAGSLASIFAPCETAALRSLRLSDSRAANFKGVALFVLESISTSNFCSSPSSPRARRAAICTGADLAFLARSRTSTASSLACHWPARASAAI